MTVMTGALNADAPLSFPQKNEDILVSDRAGSLFAVHVCIFRAKIGYRP